jgi:hypothetical protein
MTIEGITDIFAEQARLNIKKRILNLQPRQTAEEWLKLAREYQEIDSRGNFAYCTKKAQYYGARIERDVVPDVPEPEARDWTDH